LDFALLADRPETIPIIARWYFDQWGERSPGATVATICTNLEKYLNRTTIPLLVLALDHDDILGVASLKYREMDIYPDREHWLGGVYVPAVHRGRSVGSCVVENVVERARSLDVSTLHLQTDRLDGGMYGRLGWKESERVTYRGREVLVMERRCGPCMAPDAIRLRQAEATDADFIYRVVEATMRDYVEQIWGSFSEDYNRKNTAESIAAGICSVIEWEGQDIGVLAVERHPTHIQLAQIYILPSHQNRGIGTRLIRDLAREARESGRPLRLRVLSVNPARRLYEREGFKVTSITLERVFMELYRDSAT